MNKKRFVDIINALKSADKLQKDINALMRTAKENIENDFQNGASLMINHECIVIELLEEIMEDDYNTISWWMYDTECGKSKPEIYDKEGNIIADLKTPEDLYYYLINLKISE